MIKIPISLIEFQKQIFETDANVSAPVVIYSEHDLQERFDSINEMQRHSYTWYDYVVLAGIAQYSLQSKKPAGVLARRYLYTRFPTMKEIESDIKRGFKLFGVTENWRVLKSVISTKVFTGDLPKDISDLINEVDKWTEEGDNIFQKNYEFAHAVDGQIKDLDFSKIEEYDASKLEKQDFDSCIQIKDGKLQYYHEFPSKEDMSRFRIRRFHKYRRRRNFASNTPKERKKLKSFVADEWRIPIPRDLTDIMYK